MAAPITFTWDGEVMKPLRQLARQCDRQFVVGENYRLEVVQDRSGESHRHYFAAINEAFENLPEVYAGRWLTADKFRKWLLVQAEYCNTQTYIAKSKAEALRFAAFLMSIEGDACVEVDGCLIAVKTPKSQSYTEMTRKEFQESKQAVLDLAAGMIGVSPDDLSAQTRRSPSLAPTHSREMPETEPAMLGRGRR